MVIRNFDFPRDEGDFIAIIVGDPHNAARAPRSRKDNYSEAVLNKQREIVALGTQLNADGIFLMGDVFSSPYATFEVTGEVTKVYQESTAPVFSLMGNHDIYGGNTASYRRTPIGLLDIVGAVKVIPSHRPIFHEKGDLTIQITAQHFDHAIDIHAPEPFYCRTKAPHATHAIHLVHGYLTEKPLLHKHTLIESIENQTEADVTLSGHLHQGFHIERNGKIFHNPGGLVRTNAQHTVKVSILKITQEGEISIMPYHLQNVAPIEDVLDMERVAEEESRQINLDDFRNKIERTATQINRLIDVDRIIEEVAVSEEIEGPVKDYTLQQIAAQALILAESMPVGEGAEHEGH